MGRRVRDLGDKEYRLLADFRYAVRGFLAFSKQAVAEAGLAPQQYQALLAIRARRDREFTISDLAHELYIRHNSAVELVDRLERSDLVARKSAGGRRIALHLTASGEAMLEGLAEVHLAELKRHALPITKLIS